VRRCLAASPEGPPLYRLLGRWCLLFDRSHLIPLTSCGSKNQVLPPASILCKIHLFPTSYLTRSSMSPAPATPLNHMGLTHLDSPRYQLLILVFHVTSHSNFCQCNLYNPLCDRNQLYMILIIFLLTSL
jgi:hypothetical protein